MASDGFDQPSGLADRVDDLLLRVESWSERSRSAGVAVVLVVAAILLGWWLIRPTGHGAPIDERLPLAEPGLPSPVVAPTVAPTVAAADPVVGPTVDEEPLVELVVHVVGEVARPGLVSVDPGARISDAVDAAGGPLETAEVERLNLAMPVVDGMQVRVPAADEASGGAGGESLVRLAPTASSSTGETGPQPGPVDLNQAGQEQLETLPGVGPAIAGAIVSWRDDNGGFATVDDLLDVPGIGPAKLAALRDRVVV